MLRQVLITFVGHVDHGKSSILDYIRETSIVKSEAGGITQQIYSWNIPFSSVKKICGTLLKETDIKIPGFLAIDTPGHAAFNNLRKRGGNLADLAVLVIDINEGLKEQTLECIEILKSYKTPFVIALNKIDLIPGWRPQKDIPLIKNIESQYEGVQNEIDARLYRFVGELFKHGINADRFDRIQEYTKTVAIVPCSAKKGDGIPELLLVLAGLAQKFLAQHLEIEEDAPGEGIVLEVKEEKGGSYIEAILHNGSLKVNDLIAIGGIESPIVTKVRGMIMQINKGMRPIKEAHAAAGIRLIVSEIKDVLAGMPFKVARGNIEKIKEEIQKEIEEVTLEVDNEGIILKADSLGSLEALANLVRNRGIKVKKASIGKITKKDLADAEADNEHLNRVILGFNVEKTPSEHVKVITHNIIYHLIEGFENWIANEKRKVEEQSLEKISRPCKMVVLKDCIFRQSNPAIVGVDVVAGILETGVELMKDDGKKVAEVKSIQLDKENVPSAEKGKQVAISLPGITIGRQIDVGTELYSSLTDEEFRKLRGLKKYLKTDEIELLKEIAKIKRKDNPVWGI